MTMLIDPDTIRQKLRELRGGDTKATGKEQQQATCLELVLEMRMRGIRFLPVNLYKSDVKKFLVEDGNLRCPFTSLGGLGESAAVPIVEARQAGPFLSVEDLVQRARVGSGVVELLRQHGSLEGMSETSQVSMF